MLLTGSYRRSLDDKLRIALPKPLREAVGDSQLFITPGTDRALVIYTGQKLEEISAALEKVSPAAKEARSFSRLFFAQAQPCELDKQGRLRIAPELASLSDLQDEAMLIGVRDRIEVWNAAAWDQFLQESQPSYDELAEKVFAEATRQRGHE